MSRAIVTICCGEFFQRLAAITHPTIKAYAERIGADFIVWRDHAGHTMPDYQKIELGKLLEQYDRVLYIDTDVLVRDDAPDLFAIVPENSLGMLRESDYMDRKIGFVDYMIAMRYDIRGWDGNYYNAGVMVLSRQHKDLFVQPAHEIDHFQAQTYVNAMIVRTKASVLPLPYRFNRMYFMDWFYGEERCDSFLIHYAGMSVFTSQDDLLKLVADDRASWERTRPEYRYPKSLVFVAQGGVGDQVAAEPTIRYAREVLFKDDRLVVASPHPQLFRHLELPIYPKGNDVPDLQHYMPCCNQSNPTRAPLPIKASCVHCIDHASLNMLGIELPSTYRRPRLAVDPNAVASVCRKVEPHKLNQLVLMHAPRIAGNVTQFANAWGAYSRILTEHGCRVAVIGNRGNREIAVTEFDASGCLDLVDKLTLDEIIAIISEAPVLLSSGSDLVQIAGAFDHWIGLLPPSTDPEYVLAWRNGSQSFKARYLGDPSVCGPIASLAFQAELPRYRGIGWYGARPALPGARVVLAFVLEALQDAASDQAGTQST